MRNLTSFAQGHSWLHQLDPRIKIVMLLSFSIWLVGHATSLIALTVGMVLSGLLVASAGLAWSVIWPRLLPVNLFMALVILLLPFTTPGPYYLLLDFLPVSLPGLQHALRMTLQANAVMLAVLALLATQDFITLGHALQQLRVSPKLVQLFLLTLRYLTVLYATWQQLIIAMKIRGFKLCVSWHSYRSIGQLLGMLFIRAFARAQRIELAMKCRGYRGEFYLLSQLQLQFFDALSLLLFAVILLALSLVFN